MVMAALAMSTQAKASQYKAKFDTDSGLVGVDNRCSGCISTVVDDFEGPLVASDKVIKGFGGSRTRNVMVGTIVWTWYSDDGVLHSFRIPKSYFVKSESTTRLLSPQHWAQTQLRGSRRHKSGMGETTTAQQTVLFWDEGKSKLTIPLSSGTNVASFPLVDGYSRFDAFCAEADIDYDDETNILTVNPTLVSDTESSDDDDLSLSRDSPLDSPLVQTGRQPPPDMEWCKPVQTSFDLDGEDTNNGSTPTVIIDEEDRMPSENLASQLLRLHHKFGHISFTRLRTMARMGTIPKKYLNCPIPVCSACLFGKKTRRPWRGKTRAVHSASRPTVPGKVISVDQMESPTPGLIAQMAGKPTSERYRYATVYMDQASGYGYVHLQKGTTAEETLQGKAVFEKKAADMGIPIQNYHADNGIFKASKWVTACREAGQGLTFAGVNAHHQNGVAEKRIRDLQDLARTSLIHAAKRWPKAITANLWPYALRNANMILNETPLPRDESGRSAEQIFSGSLVQANQKHYQPFGCPVAVLHQDLQSTTRIHHKWKERARIGVYLGRSPIHNQNVALVLSLETGLVSPQFHVTFDPSFHIAKEEKWESLWQIKTGLLGKREMATPEAENQAGHQVPHDQTTGNRGRKRRRTTRSTESGLSSQRETVPTQRESDPATQSAQNEEQSTPHHDRSQADLPEANKTTRSGRSVRTPSRFIQGMEATASEDESTNEIFCFESLCPDWIPPRMQMDALYAFKATADPDTMYMHEAMKEPDRAEFEKAMEKEVEDQFQNGNFTVLHKSEIPKDATVLPAVWQMRRKRDIRTRKIKKYKARLNIDGSKMVSDKHYDPNRRYAPVASWSSIRLLLTLTAVHGWKTQQLDYVLAFPQAPVEREIYMKVPKGFKVEGSSTDYVLKLNRNIYGQVQAGRVWYDYLKAKLVNELGFKQADYDECVFLRGKTMYVLYTDDSILAGPDQKEIDQIVQDLQEAKLTITDEGDLQDFLGVNIDRKKDGTIHLTQPHLIDQILKDMRLDGDNVKVKSTPGSSSKILGAHPDSPEFDQAFNFRRIIGKLNYLERGSRPDIAYMTHQIARFTSSPRKEHGEALKWLGRYLKGTRDKGMILKPTKKKDLEVFVDADFAGNWNQEESTNRSTARSRHGYIIKYAGCPITWKSQLQGEICLSSTESEYTGLSYALREVIPLMELLKEMKAMGFPVDGVNPTIHCKVFEDNSGALEMARIHKYRPRTKHLNVKLHHFRDYVVRKEISIMPIGTDDQEADYLTKPVNEEILTRHRMSVQGW